MQSKKHARVPISMTLHLVIAMVAGMSAARVAAADTPDCPYPCLPPPTASSSYPPPPPSGAFGYPPPAFPAGYPAPPGFYTPPGFYAPPYSAYPAPPPPNPILPWFPWYYRHDNPITPSSSAATAAPRLAACMGAVLGGVVFPVLMRLLVLVL